MSNGHDKSALLFGYGVNSHQLCRGFPIDKIASATNALSWWMSVPSQVFKRVLFTLHHDLQEKEPKLQKATMMSTSMKVHVSSLHAPIYRNFYKDLCVGK